ncbi:MAG: hypothetical protein NKF70_08875 [Methanobacterium sp. ERen5]|nr:MAG: hypothetical protein NKF70_08875 [Methanobacterium sp. ERen5]
MLLASPAAFATNLHTQLDGVDLITCDQGNKVIVSAQLWTENYVNGLWDNPMNHYDLYFHLYTKDHDEVLEKKVETDFTGKATAEINTEILILENIIYWLNLKKTHGYLWISTHVQPTQP